MVSKSQINLRLPDTLIEALKAKADAEGETITGLVTQLLKEDLGLEPETPDNSQILENRVNELEKRLRQQEQILEGFSKLLQRSNGRDLPGVA